MNKRVQLSRKAGWKKPECAVVVSRPSVFGNPFSVKFWGRKRSVQMYRWMMSRRWKPIRELCRPHMANQLQLCMVMMELMIRRHQIMKALPKLQGRDVACWCKLGEECHGDVLLSLAGKELERRRARRPRSGEGND